MPKYLVESGYTTEGTRGLLSEGGTGRRQAVDDVVRSCGGTLEWMYFALGDPDTTLYCVVDMPDDISMVASNLRVHATGTVRSRVIPLLGPEDIDAAARKSVEYRPAGA